MWREKKRISRHQRHVGTTQRMPFRWNAPYRVVEIPIHRGLPLRPLDFFYIALHWLSLGPYSQTQIVNQQTVGLLGTDAKLITYVTDRPSDHHHCAIDARKIEREQGWKPAETFDTGIRKTVEWYLTNQKWVSGVMDGSYRDWIVQQYEASNA